MPRIDYVYICPVCHEEFSTEEDALECCEIRCRDGIICDCDSAFIDPYEFQSHASRCARAKPSCLICNHYDAGARIRHIPCERDRFSDDLEPCEDYVRTKCNI